MRDGLEPWDSSTPNVDGLKRDASGSGLGRALNLFGVLAGREAREPLEGPVERGLAVEPGFMGDGEQLLVRLSRIPEPRIPPDLPSADPSLGVTDRADGG
jgi:hypothetical protein